MGVPIWCLRSGVLALALLTFGCGRPAPEPVAPTIVVPESLKPPPPGSPALPLLTLAPPREPPVEARPSDDEPPVAAPRTRPSGGPIVPPPVIGRCLRSRLCQLEGLCSWTDDGRCVAGSDDDCRPSDACLGGRCTAKEERCVADSDADCRGSWACKGWGRCDHDGDESCVAESAADCRASTRCQREGECTLRGGACVK